MKINKDRTGRGLTVESLYSQQELKEKMNIVAENMVGVFVPSEVNWEGAEYTFYISHRQSLKEYACETGITRGDFFLFIKKLAELFKSASENGIKPHEFVYDYECIFVGDSLEEPEFIYAPDRQTYKDGAVVYNKCSDMAALLALYIEYDFSEKSLKQEKYISQILKVLTEWEANKNIYDTKAPLEELKRLADEGGLQSRFGNYLKNTFYGIYNGFAKKRNDAEEGCAMRLNGEMLLKGIEYKAEENASDNINIGRDEDWADLAVDVMYVSRKHAEIYKENETWFIKDLNSKNGTFVNGTRIASGRPFSLGNGYEIGFGVPESKVIFCLP